MFNPIIFQAPRASYSKTSFPRNLCTIPWNPMISPGRTGGVPCLWFPAPKAASVVMYFHANSEDIGTAFHFVKHMRDQFKVNVIAVEYPGYGLLQGIEPAEETIFEVALTVFRYLVDDLRVSYSSVIVFGRSLGSGPAIFLASQYPLGGMILVSPFISIRAAAKHIGGRIVAFMFSNVFQNHKRMVNVSCPVLFIHGASDSLIPVEHSKTLFSLCRSRKLLITPAKMDHNSSMFSDPNAFAVPAIHFFGFPGWRTLTPPFMPFDLFEAHRLDSENMHLRDGSGKKMEGPESWLYNCCGKLSEESDQVLVKQEKTLQEECVQNDYV
ncbi:abhd13 [Symbiodinium sp. CCMP2592]|nr:abhd13 [Symbiodinium sp. CCMP2592]